MWITEPASAAELVPVWIGAIAAAVGALVAIVAIALTYRQLRLTSIQIRDSARRESQNSEDQTRPYVGLDVVTSVGGSPAFDLVIANFGRTTARRIVLSIVGREFEAQSDQDAIGPALGRLFAVPFDLAPGARRRVFWHFPDDENSTPRGSFGAPAAGELRAAYVWEPGGNESERQYTEHLQYDLSEYAKLIPRPAAGSTAQGKRDDPAVIGQNSVHTLRAIARHLGELRR